MHNHVPIFRVGDMILVGADSAALRAQIVNFRTVKTDLRALQERYGCDVITEEMGVRFYSLDDIVKWNPHKVQEWFK